ncbi:MAG: hypothetical protein HN948_07105 [Clostridia bacterium]|jgi:hypothetical protein|nr:hypothetical protein [Clostridia bacterium]MBT7122761.1 hypothetical protein [Clostridia bacterium]
MRKLNLSSISILVSLLVIAAIVCVVFLSIDQDGVEEKHIEQVRDSVISSVAQCYALEGSYPSDLQYLQENYGLQLDTDRYIYHYEKFASNILPDVQVFVKTRRGD